MVRVKLNGKILAESDETITVENNHYFPAESVVRTLLTDSSTTSVCPWKGTAAYYNADLDGEITEDVAWYYPEPEKRVLKIKNYVAFYKNKVEIEN